MQVLNNAELAFLSILAYPELTDKALHMYAARTFLFTQTFCPHLFTMWSAYLAVIKRNRKKCGLDISKDVIAAGISEALQHADGLPDSMMERCDQLLTRLVSGDVPSIQDGTDLVERLVQLDVNRKISAKITMNADILELQKTLDESRKVLVEFGGREETEKNRFVFNPFRDMEELSVHTERIPTGINWLDELTSGGGRAGELWLVLGPSGGGKCLGKDTPVLMYDGSIKMSQDIVVGDVLMGPDSMPRNVLQLGRGRSKMYKIIPCLGMPYVVNSAHILTLECGSTYGVSVNGKHVCAGERVDISVEDYLKLPKNARVGLKGVRTGVDFHLYENKASSMSPYFCGLYIGAKKKQWSELILQERDLVGYVEAFCEANALQKSTHRPKYEPAWTVSFQSEQTNPSSAQFFSFLQKQCANPYVPISIKCGSRKARRSFLAGLIDVMGSKQQTRYTLPIKNGRLAEDVLFVARSLGYAAYSNEVRKFNQETRDWETKHRVLITGDLSQLPLKVARKKIPPRSRCNDVLRTGITVEELPEDDYYGFVIDGDRRFLLGDFTVTHNTALSVQYSCAQALMGNTTMWATYEQSLDGDIAERIIAFVTDTSLDQIRDVGFSNLPEEIQKRFWACVAGADDRLVVLDMTKVQLNSSEDSADNGGMYSVWKQYKQLKQKGVKVKTIIIDWFGAMMSLIGSVTGKDLAKGFRFYAQAEIDIARKMVKEEDLQIIFFHQTDSVSQHARPTYVPDKTCAKDMKDMCNYMDIVITMGVRDPNSVCWMNAAKSRKGATIKKTVELLGDKSRFIQANGWFPNRDGNFYKPADDYPDSDEEQSDTAVVAYSREIE